MQTALRKMGNSTGMIVPRSILGEIGVSIGTTMDLTVQDGKLIATPVSDRRRDGWAAAASIVAEEPNETEAWQGFANEDDDDLTW
jgi:antitoxin MazE